MQFCDSCGETMVKVGDDWVCRSCDPDAVETSGEVSDSRTPAPRPAELNDLPMTDSGSVRKADAMKWLDGLDEPSAAELKRAFIPKPNGFTGSSYPTSI